MPVLHWLQSNVAGIAAANLQYNSRQAVSADSIALIVKLRRWSQINSFSSIDYNAIIAGVCKKTKGRSERKLKMTEGILCKFESATEASLRTD